MEMIKTRISKLAPRRNATATLPGLKLASLQRTPSSLPLISSSMNLKLSNVTQRLIPVPSLSQAWYQYMTLLISLAGVKLSFRMFQGSFLTTPKISNNTTKPTKTANRLQAQTNISKLKSTVEKREISSTGLLCKTSYASFSSVHSSGGFYSRTKFRLLPSLGATSFFTLFTLVFLETMLLSTVSNCAKTFYMHWNTSNSIFRIDNTDHIIDVNKGNLAFEFDQVHIICPVYEPGTFENETEKYIIYNVSKVEYETCRITNADPRVIAICDKPQKLMFFTITFRPFTPQPGGLEFLPGNDYYFISTSSKDDLYRRIGGRCSTNNMKVVFKVCCASEENNKTASITDAGSSTSSINSPDGTTTGIESSANLDISNTQTDFNQHTKSNINTIGINSGSTGLMSIGVGSGIGAHKKSMNVASTTSINKNLEQFNRIPSQGGAINVIGNNIANLGNIELGAHGGGGIMLTSGGHGGINMISTGGSGFGIGQYPRHPGQTGIRVNNVASQHHGSHKNIANSDDRYDKHPNEVVKNEELTYNSGAACKQSCVFWKLFGLAASWSIADVFNWLLGQNHRISISAPTKKSYNEYEYQQSAQSMRHSAFFFSEAVKRHLFLAFSFSAMVFCSIVIISITTFKFTLNTKIWWNEGEKSIMRESFSKENVLVSPLLLDTLDVKLNEKPRLHIPLQLLNTAETVFLPHTFTKALFQYCHDQISSIQVKKLR